MSFQRMVAIPHEEYVQLTTVQNARQPLTQQMYNLESDYNTKEIFSDPYKRLMLQSETLQDMIDLKERMRSSIQDKTPKLFVNRAVALFNSVKPFMKFNDRAEIIDKDGKVIEDSRLEDLIQHAVKDKRRDITPIGWQEFIKMLREHNVPRFMLNRDTLEEMANITPMTKPMPAPSRIPVPTIVRRREVDIRPSRKREHSPQITLRKRTSSVERRAPSARKKRKSTRFPNASSDFIKTSFLKKF